MTDTPLTAATWAALQDAFPAYEDDQLALVILMPKVARAVLKAYDKANPPVMFGAAQASASPSNEKPQREPGQE